MRVIRLGVLIVHDRRRADLIPSLLAGIGPPRSLVSGVIEWVHVAAGGSGIDPWTGLKTGIVPLVFGVGTGATHILVLEDDAAPPVFGADADRDAYWASVVGAVASRPTDVLSFFATNAQAGGPMLASRSRGLSWAFVSERPVGALALAAPVGVWARFMRWMMMPGAEYEYLDCFRPGPVAAGAGDARIWWWWTTVCGRAIVVAAHGLFGHGRAAPNESLVHAEAQARRVAFLPVVGVRGELAEGYYPVDAARIDWTLGASIPSDLDCLPPWAANAAGRAARTP